jgi:hypothetical protein
VTTPPHAAPCPHCHRPARGIRTLRTFRATRSFWHWLTHHFRCGICSRRFAYRAVRDAHLRDCVR